MNNLITRFTFAFMLLLLSSGNIFAQNEDDKKVETIKPIVIEEDNPLYDRIPQEFRNTVNPLKTALAVEVLNGYDEFNIGTDFGEPHIALNPKNPVQAFTAFNINAGHYTMDGVNWSAVTPNFGQTMQGDPVVAYDSLGNLYYENMYGSSSILGCYVVKSSNNGMNWGPGVLAISGNDKNWIAADQTAGPYANYIYTVMTPGNFRRSTDLGATFTNTATFSTQSLPGAMVAVGANVLGGNNVSGGVVYVVTNSGSSFASTYTFYASTNGGLNFSQKSQQNFSGYVGTDVGGRNSVQNMRTRPYPYITADNSWGPFRGRLYLIYASNFPAGSGNKPNIYSRYSTDHGATWSAAVMVNDDLNTAANNQWHPAIWCDKNSGKLFVQWMDTRDTPTSDSAYIYATYSTDGGATFVQNQRISNKKMKINCATCGGGGTPRYQGDYNGVTSFGNISTHVWTDFRNGQFGSYVAYFPDFAMTVSTTVDTLYKTNDSSFITVKIPGVRLYSDTAYFTGVVTPAPASGSFSVEAVGHNYLTSFPDSLQLRIKTVGSVTMGTYTLTIKGNGPSGIPAHNRTVTIKVVDDVPVELISFSAIPENEGVRLHWATSSETNNQGFAIERKEAGSEVWNKLGFVQGYGTTTERHDYSFMDNKISGLGEYVYRIKQMDFNGTYEYSSEINVNVDRPYQYSLSQNYPNPFNPVTSIRYSLPVKGIVTLKIYDILGNEIKTLVNEEKEAGSYRIDFNASELSSGVYIYKIISGNFTDTKKLTLLK